MLFIFRDERLSALTIDNGTKMITISTGPLKQLNTNTGLYLGKSMFESKLSYNFKKINIYNDNVFYISEYIFKLICIGTIVIYIKNKNIWFVAIKTLVIFVIL